MNTAATHLVASPLAFLHFGRVDLPPANPNALQGPPRHSSSALFTPKGESTYSGTNEALQAGGTRKKRDRLHRKWKPGSKTENIEHKRQDREQVERRRQERQQPSTTTRTLSSAQPILSPHAEQQAGGGYVVEQHPSEHSTSSGKHSNGQRKAPQRPSAGPSPLLYSSTANDANLGPSFPSPVGEQCVCSGNPAGSSELVPERSQREQNESASSLAAVEQQRGKGGINGPSTGPAIEVHPAAVLYFGWFSSRGQCLS